MEKGFWKLFKKLVLKVLMLLIVGALVVSCKDKYVLDDQEPEWLGQSIYDYLVQDGHFTTLTKLIDDVEYKTVLSKTGSKTLFAVRDDAFKRFFESNPWGVTSYEKLTLTQKRLLLNFSMINNAYLIETLSNYYDGSLNIGTALRRNSSISVLDYVPLEKDNLPSGTFWDNYRNKGLYILKDASSWPIVHFMQSNLENAKISNEDFKLITGVERVDNDAHIFNIKVVERDITCKNGYIHVLEDVLFPKVNIAEYLKQNSNTQIFSKLLERFCAPYFNSEMTKEYNETNLDNPVDSIFEKLYFSSYDGTIRYPNGERINSELLLPFNPGRNSYVKSLGALQSDMAAILAPTDAAMTAYFETGTGVILKERYGSWENIPDPIIMLLVKRHLRESFLETIPSRFGKMNDAENSPLSANSSDITASYVGVNGVVYETNKVYPPDDYVSVYAPVLFSAKTKVFNWAVVQNDFRLYLNSLVSRYSFFVPTDEFFKNYIDPIAFSKDVKAAIKYWYNSETSKVDATIYSYDDNTNTVGDSIGYISSEYNQSFIVNRLLDILDSHIVIGDVESGSTFYFTKSGNSLKVEGAGSSLRVQGGDDVKKGIYANVVPGGVFNQYNGKTYFIDKPLQTPLQSVYKVLSTTPEFSEFFKLLNGFSGNGSLIFVKKSNFYGMDFNISFFNTFNYTVYVPTNAAIQQAIADGIISDWTKIDAMTNEISKEAEIDKLERFLRYHFQDNSVYIGGNSVNTVYQTATIKMNDVETKFGTYKNKYYKLGVHGDGNSLSLETEIDGTASVVKDNGLYNIMVRDYIFSDNPKAYKEIDGTGSGKEMNTSSITTSSTAVIHQIDKVLRFE